jgi:hypothetical protein
MESYTSKSIFVYLEKGNEGVEKYGMIFSVGGE